VPRYVLGCQFVRGDVEGKEVPAYR